MPMHHRPAPPPTCVKRFISLLVPCSCASSAWYSATRSSSATAILKGWSIPKPVSQPALKKKTFVCHKRKKEATGLSSQPTSLKKKSHSFVCHKERKKETTTGLSELSLPVPACLLLQLRRLLLQRRRGRLLLELVEGGAHQKLGVGALLLGVLVVNVVVGWGLR